MKSLKTSACAAPPLTTEKLSPSEWEFYMAFSMFRLAAILQGIAKRAQDGTAASATARETGARARPIAHAAWQQVESL